MQEDQKIRVLSTTAMIDDLVKEIGKEYIHSTILIKGEVDPHSYELVKGDAEKLSMAELVFANGLGLEHGASIQYALLHREGVTFLGDHLTKERLIKVDGIVDPHVWMDVSLWSEAVDPIVEALSKRDPARSGEYRARGEAVKKKLSDLDLKVNALMQSIPPSQRFLVTSHDAFNYFAKRYLATEDERKSGLWKHRFQAPEGLSPDGQLGMHNIEEMIKHLKDYNIVFVFPESNVSLDSLKKIHSVAKAKGQTIYFAKTPLYGDSMCGDGIEAANYEEMILHNARIINGYLSSRGEENASHH